MKFRHTIQSCILAAGVVLAGLALPAATRVTAAPPACSTVGITLASAQGANPIFYTDLGATPSLNSAYTGWRVTNSGVSTRSGLWVRLGAFTSPGTLRLGVNANEPNAYPLSTLAAGASDMAYQFLTASGISAAVQNYDVQVWQGDPRLASSTQLCQDAASYKRVDDTIQANANKVSGTLVGPNPPGLGGVVTLTVYGQGTGTVGAGPSDDAGVFWMTPAAVSTWQPNAYQLQSARLMIDPDDSGPLPVTTFSDTLRKSFTGGDRPYSIVYTFVTIGVTTGSTATYPVQNIASGTQVKHTTLTGYDSAANFPAIQPAGNVTTLTKTAAASTVLPGATVQYAVTVNAGNFGTTFADLNGDGDVTDPGETTVNSGVLDSIRDVVPSGASYVAGSATWQGSAIADPVNTAGTLVFAGPLLLASNTTPQLKYSLLLPSAGTYVNSAYGVIGSTRIDTTLTTTDSSPSSVAVQARANTAPVVGGTASGTGPEDNQVTGTLTATDIDGDTLTWSITTPATNGTATVTGGSWTFTPDADWHGTTTFVVRVSDGNGGTTDQTVTVTVTPVNDPPVITGGLSGSGPEDTDISGAATATDIDGGPLTWSLQSGPSNGSVIVGANGSWTYTPDADWHGVDTFDVLVSDGNGGTDTATVTVTVGAVNDPPVVTGGLTGSGPMNQTVGGTATATDADNDTLTWSTSSQPIQGVATITPSGAWTLVPANSFVGTLSFGIVVSDGNGGLAAGVVTVELTPPNAPPVVTGGLAGSGPEDTIISDTANATDPENDTLTWSIDTQPANGIATINPTTGTWTYFPDPDYTGTDSFTIEVTDGTSTTAATVNLTVTANRSIDSGVYSQCQNDTPWMYWDVIATGFDPTGHTATIEWINANGDVVRTTTGQPLSGRQLWPGAAIDTDGNPTAWPGWQYIGGVWEQVDDGLRDGMKVRVSVNPTDTVDVIYPPATPLCIAEPPAAPVANDITASGPEDTTVTGTILATDPNTDATLTYSITDDPAHGTATINPTTGLWSFIPDTDWNGITTLDVTITDNTGTTTTITITITITPVNDPPTVVGTPSGFGAGDPITGTVDSDDVDGDNVTASVDRAPAHGSVTVDPDGSWIYTPDAGWEGTDSFDVLLADGNGGTVTVTVPVTTSFVKRDVVVRGFWDLDGNGTRDAGEPWLADTVRLGATTDAGPSATFTDIAVGSATAGASASGFGGPDVPVTITPDNVPLNVDVALEADGESSAGVAWDDDGNGTPDRWVAGAVVTATWWGPDGLVGTDDDVTVTLTTGVDGRWRGGLPLGGWTLTYPAGSTTRTLSLATGGALEMVLSATPAPTTTTTTTTTITPAPPTTTPAPTAIPSPIVAPATTTTVVAPTTTSATATTGLPGTGSSAEGSLALAAALVLLGWAVLTWGRRRPVTR